MLAWSVAVLFCRFPVLCKLFSVLNWPIDNLNVARSIGRLLDHDSLIKPLPLV